MKLLKTITATAVVIAIASGLCSCKNDKSGESTVSEETYATISVDSLLADPAVFAGDTIIVEGMCSHLCSHGGRKAFLAGTDQDMILRCEATDLIGGAFSPDCVGKKLSVTGVVSENRIGEADILQMEQQHAQSEGKTDHACATDAKAQGQDSVCEFDARMADYRSRIAERAEKEGKDYLSFFYLEAIAYNTAE